MIWCFLYFWSNLALFCNKVYYWIITFRVLYWCKVAGCRSNVAQIKWTWISHVLQLDIHWLCRIVDDMSYLVLKYLEHCVSLHLSTLLSNFSFPRHVFLGFPHPLIPSIYSGLYLGLWGPCSKCHGEGSCQATHPSLFGTWGKKDLPVAHLTLEKLILAKERPQLLCRGLCSMEPVEHT